MFDRRNRARRSIASGVVVGVLAGALLGVIELVVLRVFDRGAAGLVGGLPALVLPLLGPCALAGLLLGLVGGLVWWSIEEATDVLAKTRVERVGVQARLGAAVLAPLAAWAAVSGFEGRRAQSMALRPLWIALAALALVAGAWAVLRVVLLVGERTGEGPHKVERDALAARPGLIGLATVLVLVAAGALIADRRVLPRLYPALHVGLEAGAFAALGLAILAGAQALHATHRRLGRLAKPEGALAVLLIAAALGAFGIARVNKPERQGLRAVIFEASPLGGRLLDGFRAVGVAPPPQAPIVAPSVVAGATATPLGPGVRAAGHDVILITVDALRADHLGAWGYPRATSPRLDGLAAEGTRFERAYAPVPHTSFSIASILLGKHAYALDQLGLLGRDPTRHETLAQVARRYGYQSAAFFPPAVFYVDGEHFKGFEETRYGFEYVRYEPFKEHEDADARTAQVLAYLAKEAPPRVLLWVHYFGPHEPYTPHPELGPEGDFGPRGVDRYDGEIRWVDGAIGELVDGIRATRPGAIIVVTADHGEEFGEHGGAYHGTTLHDEQLRVPLIIAGPGIAPHSVKGPVSTVDLVPTILGMLDVPASARATGTDLGPWLATPPAPEEALPPVAAAIGDLKMVARGTEKLICDTQRDFCRLFDLAADPGEQHDVAGARPERVAALRGALEAWLAGIGAAETSVDPLGARRGAVERAALGDRAAWAEAASVVADAAVPVDARRQTAAVLARGIAGLDPALVVDDAVKTALAKGRGADPELDGWVDVALAACGDADARTRLEKTKPTTFTALARARGREAETTDALVTALAATGEVEEQRLLLGALGRGRDARALPALEHAYAEIRTRRYAAMALGALGRPEAVPFLIARLADEEYTTVRAVVADALGKIGDRAALPALRAAAAKDPDAQVRAAATAALGLF